jgi:hypothetical protein
VSRLRRLGSGWSGAAEVRHQQPATTQARWIGRSSGRRAPVVSSSIGVTPLRGRHPTGMGCDERHPRLGGPKGPPSSAHDRPTANDVWAQGRLGRTPEGRAARVSDVGRCRRRHPFPPPWRFRIPRSDSGAAADVTPAPAEIGRRAPGGRRPGAGARARPAPRNAEAAPEWRRSAPLRLERRRSEGRRRETYRPSTLFSCPTPPGRGGAVSARASGPGSGPRTSRTAELKRGEIQDDQRSQRHDQGPQRVHRSDPLWPSAGAVPGSCRPGHRIAIVRRSGMSCDG